MWLTFFFKLIYVFYLCESERIFHLLAHSPNTSKIQCWAWLSPGTGSLGQTFFMKQGTNSLSHHLLPPMVSICRKLKSEAKLQLKTNHSDMECGVSDSVLITVRCLPCYLFLLYQWAKKYQTHWNTRLITLGGGREGQEWTKVGFSVPGLILNIFCSFQTFGGNIVITHPNLFLDARLKSNSHSLNNKHFLFAHHPLIPVFIS